MRGHRATPKQSKVQKYSKLLLSQLHWRLPRRLRRREETFKSLQDTKPTAVSYNDWKGGPLFVIKHYNPN